MKHIKLHILSILNIGAIVFLLAIVNYDPGTYLTGWDNLQTDLNPLLGLKRAFYSVWEEYQSFGLLTGMAHGADFVRSIWMSILSLFFPQDQLRYMSFIIYLSVGMYGMYFYLRMLFKSHSFGLSTLLGALMYGLNFGIIQLFYVPFEPFSYFFASLPWLIYAFHRYVFEQKKGLLGWMIVINILATPSYYLQTLFVVYMLFIGLYALGMVFMKPSREVVMKCVRAIIIICMVNIFWLFPQIYFVLQSGGVVHTAKINQIATEDVGYQNQEKGTLDNFFRQRGFYYELENIRKDPLFWPWKEHFQTWYGIVTSWIIAGLIILGIVVRSRYRKLFIGPLILVGIFLLQQTPVFEQLNTLLRTNGFVNQIFRSPFTKFGVAQAFIFAYFFAAGTQALATWGLRKEDPPTKPLIISILLGCILLISVLPAFEGHYIARDMRVTIPQDYHDTIEHFRTVDKNKRIALMPDYTFWGWFFTDWGYNGSGFLWYGIEQPIVSRTFDVWSTSSEAYFWDMKAALEAEDVQAMEHVLEKYAIDYIIVDHSLRPVSSGDKALQKDRLAEMLKSSGRIRQFGAGKILSLYIFERNSAAQDFVSLSGPLQSVGPDVTYPVGSLFTEPYSVEEHPDIYFPFRNLTSQTRITEDQWAIQEFENSFMLIGRIPTFPDLYQLDAPYDVAPVELFVGGEPRQFSTPFTYALDKVAGTISVTIPKALLQKIEPGKANVYDCTRSTVRRSDTDTRIAYVDGSIRVSSSTGATPCLGYDFPELNQRFGYLVSLKTRNLEGRRPFIAITDKTKDQPMIEDRLDADNEFFMLPPHFQYGQGYILTLQNNSYVGTPSTNLIDSVETYLFPIEQVRNIRFVKLEGANVADSARQQFSAPAQVDKRAYHAYTVDLSAQDVALNEYLVLHQAYHAGWKAFWVPTDPISLYIPFIAGEPVDSYDHVKINDWEQGWKIPTRCAKDGGCRMVLIFWPQYLQWLGFALAIAAPGIIFARKLRNKQSRTNEKFEPTTLPDVETGI